MANDLFVGLAEWPVRLRIEQVGALVLHAAAREVTTEELATPAVQRLIDLMFATLAGTGVGLAAPQVGVPLRLVVIHDPAESHLAVPASLLEAQERGPVAPHVLVNPVLSVEDPTPAEFFEGCLSVEGYRAIVSRARTVRVQALDRSGAPFERLARGWYARILQHEVDHLDGRLYLERMLPRTFVAANSVQPWPRMPVEEVKRVLAAESS